MVRELEDIEIWIDMDRYDMGVYHKAPKPVVSTLAGSPIVRQPGNPQCHQTLDPFPRCHSLCCHSHKRTGFPCHRDGGFQVRPLSIVIPCTRLVRQQSSASMVTGMVPHGGVLE